MPDFDDRIAIESFNEEEYGAIRDHDCHHKEASVSEGSLDSEDRPVENEDRDLCTHDTYKIKHIADKQ